MTEQVFTASETGELFGVFITSTCIYKKYIYRTKRKTPHTDVVTPTVIYLIYIQLFTKQRKQNEFIKRRIRILNPLCWFFKPRNDLSIRSNYILNRLCSDYHFQRSKIISQDSLTGKHLVRLFSNAYTQKQVEKFVQHTLLTTRLIIFRKRSHIQK